MKAKVLGVQSVDYVSKKSNQQVTGVTLHLSYPRDNVSGEAVETVFISERSAVDVSKVKPGVIVGLSYNRWGSVESLELC